MALLARRRLVVHSHRRRALGPQKQQLGLSLQLGQMLSGTNESIPVGSDVFWWAADLGHYLRSEFDRNHLDGIPRANGELVGICFLLRNMDADFTTDAALDIDLAPRLISLHPVLHFLEVDAIDRADFQARLATGAIVGVDDRDFLRQLFARPLLCHGAKHPRG